jgi:hypothetical protein
VSSSRLAAVLLVVGGAAWADGFTWTVPEVVSSIDVPGTQLVDGIPTRIVKVYHSRWPLEELAMYFAKEFDKAGFFIDSGRHTPRVAGGMVVTALDPKTLVSYTAILKPETGKGRTMVIAGEAKIQPWVDAHGHIPPGPDFAPLFPRAENVARTRVEGLNLLTFSVRAKAEEVQAFYADSLGREGFAHPEPDTFLLGKRRIVLRVRPTAGTAGRVSILLRETSDSSD